MPIDNKYGRVTLEHGNIGEDEPVFIFRGQDVIVPRLLGAYLQLCVEAGSPIQHLRLILEGLEQIQDWQEKHNPRVPDSSSYYERIEDPDAEEPRPDPNFEIIMHLEDVLDILADRAAAARRKGREALAAGREQHAAAMRGKAIGLQQGADQVQKVLSVLRKKEDGL